MSDAFDQEESEYEDSDDSNDPPECLPGHQMEQNYAEFPRYLSQPLSDCIKASLLSDKNIHYLNCNFLDIVKLHVFLKYLY